MSLRKDGRSTSPNVAIVGAGLAGIMLAITLQKDLSFTNYTIYEQSNDVGGTWNWNTYPGCASDVATHFYSYSRELNPDWELTHVFQPDLKAYWKRLATKHDVLRHISFNTKVLGAQWDVKKQVYRVELVDVLTGQTRTEYANALVSAIGSLDVPHSPEELKGIRDAFKGEHFHSARWDHSVSLRNKRVAVIGNGCSAAQFVPRIVEDPTTQVMNFCRTPNWVLPKWQQPIPWLQRKIFKYVPFIMRLHRWITAIQYEINYILIRGGSHNSKREEVMRTLVQYMKEHAPPEYHERLTPKFPLGCKRFIVDSGYYDALHKPNNDLNYDGIAQVTETGITTKKGEHFDFDVIIEATGFVVDEYPIAIRGSGGETIQEYNRRYGGPRAYRGTTVPGFPNFFIIFGPNMSTGHSSVIATEEAQIGYIAQMLKPVVRGLASSFEVTHEATDSYNDVIQAKLSKGVWSVCQSWYRAGHSGKNVAIFPGFITQQYLMLRSPVWGHYKGVGAQKWEAAKRFAKFRRVISFSGIFAALVWAYLHPGQVTVAKELLSSQLQTLIRAAGAVFH